VCKGEKVYGISAVLTAKLSDAGLEPSLPRENVLVIHCCCHPVSGKFITEIACYVRRGTTHLISLWGETLALWGQCLCCWEWENTAHIAVSKASSHCLYKFILTPLLVNCLCFKRKWNSDLSLCIQRVSKREFTFFCTSCFGLHYILWSPPRPPPA